MSRLPGQQVSPRRLLQSLIDKQGHYLGDALTNQQGTLKAFAQFVTDVEADLANKNGQIRKLSMKIEELTDDLNSLRKIVPANYIKQWEKERGNEEEKPESE